MLGLVAMSMPATALATDGNHHTDHKVKICHNPDSNNPQILSVDLSALPAHLGHGDSLNTLHCGTPYTHNFTVHVKKIVDGGDAAPQDFSVSIHDENILGPDSDETQSFDENGDIEITGGLFHVYTVTETDPGDNYTPSYQNCTLSFLDVLFGHPTCTITNTYTGPTEPQTCNFVSDSQTKVGEADAVPSFVHINWTHGLDSTGAQWIWNAFHATPSDIDDEVVTFTRQFNVVGTPTSVMLNLAADNYYTVSVNGNPVAGCADTSNLDNFTNVEPSCDITSYVTANSVNTLTFTVTNKSGFGTDPEQNPGGLIYSVDITGASCAAVPPPAPQPAHLTVIKNVVGAPEGVDASDFTIQVEQVGGDDPTQSHAGAEAPGYTYTVDAGTYNVVEVAAENYDVTYGDNCKNVALSDNGQATCTVTNTYVPPAPVCDSNVELLTNGGFESPDVATGGWDLFGTGVTGWAVNWLNNALEVPAKMEIQDRLSGWTAIGAGSTQWAELDSDWATNNTGHDAATIIYQDITTVPGQTYTFSFDSSPRPETASGENAVDALAGGVLVGSVGASSATGNTSWTSHAYSFTATTTTTRIALKDAGTPSDSFGALVDNASLRCTAPENTATIHAKKVVCDSEAYLPNMSGSESNITSTTAQDWVDQSNGKCHLADWDFQWAPNGTGNPGDNTTGTPAGWTNFSGGLVNVPAGALVWLREKINADYIPFTGAEGGNVSAEMYCSADVLNYDNYDFIDPVVAGAHYYCVAFNAPVAQPVVPHDSHGPVQTESGSNNGDVGGGGSVAGESTASPEVLGESCGLYMDKYLRFGHNDNDPEQTKKLQTFLNKWMSSNLPITGFFGKLTEQQVKAFQSKYGDDILKPWGLTSPTGLVYLSTLLKINKLECPELTLELPPLVPWSQNPEAH